MYVFVNLYIEFLSKFASRIERAWSHSEKDKFAIWIYWCVYQGYNDSLVPTFAFYMESVTDEWAL